MSRLLNIARAGGSVQQVGLAQHRLNTKEKLLSAKNISKQTVKTDKLIARLADDHYSGGTVIGIVNNILRY